MRLGHGMATEEMEVRGEYGPDAADKVGETLRWLRNKLLLVEYVRVGLHRRLGAVQPGRRLELIVLQGDMEENGGWRLSVECEEFLLCNFLSREEVDWLHHEDLAREDLEQVGEALLSSLWIVVGRRPVG